MSNDHQPNSEIRYSVVVPVFNEAEQIGAFCAAARNLLPEPYELLFSYDFDEDNTLPQLAQLSESEKPTNIRLIRNHLGPGVRYAIEAGMRAARASVVIVTMADLSDEFSIVEKMLALSDQGIDVVCPSRYMRGGSQIGGPLLKRLLSRAAGLTLRWFTGLPTHDPTNSFKAYRSDFLRRTPIESTQGFCLALELTVKAHFQGGRVAELPTIWHDRRVGNSRFKLLAWLPHYLTWYFWAFRRRWLPILPGPGRE